MVQYEYFISSTLCSSRGLSWPASFRPLNVEASECPSILIDGLSPDLCGCLAPVTSSTVGMMSIKWETVGTKRPFDAIPCGQCAIIGVRTPPS